MPCTKYNLQSELTFETPCKAGFQPRPQAYPTETSWAYLAHLGLNSNKKQIILAAWWILLFDQACSFKMACYWPRSTKTQQQNVVTNVAQARSITWRLVNNAYQERTLARMYYPLAVENKKFLFLSLVYVNLRRIKHMLDWDVSLLLPAVWNETFASFTGT